MKKILSISLAAILVSTLFAACGGTPAAPAPAQEASSAQAPAADATAPAEEAKVVTYWYNNSGDEALVYEEAIAAYNASQNAYKVEGLSVADAQKLIVAMSSNESPDVIKISNQQTLQYQGQGLLESLQPYIDAESFDVNMYSAQALTANTAGGALFGLPLSAYTIQMFYNKDLLAAAGYSEPPATMEEMYEMAVKATVVGADGNFEVLGYPLFPYASARQELIYGFGGRWWDENNKPTPQNEGILASLNLNVQYRDLYGKDAVNNFIGTANTNRYTEQDMFFQGKQLFRLDGSWLPTMMEGFGSTVNWGIALIPGTAANPGLQGSSRFETDTISIPTTAKEKDGAWDFAKFQTGAVGAKIIDVGTGNLPALKELYDDADILAKPGFSEFIGALQAEKGIQYPVMSDLAEYWNIINASLDEVYSGAKTPADAMAEVAAASANLS